MQHFREARALNLQEWTLTQVVNDDFQLRVLFAPGIFLNSDLLQTHPPQVHGQALVRRE